MTQNPREDSLERLRSHPRVHWAREALDDVAAQRIVCLVPSLSEALVSLGLGDRLVGVTEYCVHPAGAFEGCARVGGTKDADAVAIAELSPDLVIANQEENTARVVRTLADSDIDVWVTYPRSVRDGVELLEELANLGASDEAIRRVVEPVRTAFEDQALRRITTTHAPPRVFCPIWRDPWMTINRDTYIHDLIDLCGGENLYAEGGGSAGPGRSTGSGESGGSAERGLSGLSGGPGGAPGEPAAAHSTSTEPGSDRRYPLLELEDLVERAPEVILLPDEPYAFGEADRALLAGLDTPASKAGRIHLIDGTLVSWYGPRIVESIRIVADLFAI